MMRKNITKTEARRTVSQQLKKGDPKISHVARVLGVSTRTLQRKLADGNMTFSQLIQQVRMTQACKLLRETSLSITKIACQAGYTSLSSFSRAFHGWAGASPREYRRLSNLARYDKYSEFDNGMI